MTSDVMTLDKWISLFACVSAMFSALFAAAAIIQTIKQRKSSYKPQIIINDYNFRASFDDENDYTANVLGTVTDHTYGIEVLNAGMGAAVNINYSWDFDYYKYAEHLKNKINKYKDSSLPLEKSEPEAFRYYFQEQKEVIYFRVRNKIRMMPQHIPKNPYIMKSFLPYSVDKNTSILKLPNLSIAFIVNDMLLDAKNGIHNREAEGPTLLLNFQDIGGSYITERYKTYITLYETDFMKDYIVTNGEITFIRTKNSKIINFIKQLKESYKNFIIEHDYNNHKS
ncbi:hypothetical protein SMY34_002020 [Cronobacter muytjensii]|nr:hypothetical protein [Cronobacter muytjensii]